ncbi:MAG: hypothetical protein LC776_06545 [Acidobacteria bacterium]|nr:hypothetical protein [Acidobacteriota bacterium]
MKYSKPEGHCKTHGVSALRLKTPCHADARPAPLTYVATLSGIGEGRRRECKTPAGTGGSPDTACGPGSHVTLDFDGSVIGTGKWP